jgi:hypothetical protein
VNPAIKRARRLAGQPSTGSIDLAEALWNAERAEPGSVRKLVAETGLGSRKAYYLLKTWDRFAQVDVSRGLLAEIGWTKAALIASYAPPGTEASWLEHARIGGITAKELEGRLRGDGWGKPKGHSVLLRLTPSQYRTLTRVLQRFGAKPVRKGRGFVDKERALIKALGQIPD